MHETREDLEWLQALFDTSHAAGDDHLRSIITKERLLSAPQLCERLEDVRILALATVTADGRPLVGPVDGLFHRGLFWFGSGHNSVRFRHLRARPEVSGTYVDGEQLAVTAHGVATEVDLRQLIHAGSREYCLEISGPTWDDFGAGAAYARIDPAKIFVFHLAESQ